MRTGVRTINTNITVTVAIRLVTGSILVGRYLFVRLHVVYVAYEYPVITNLKCNKLPDELACCNCSKVIHSVRSLSQCDRLH